MQCEFCWYLWGVEGTAQGGFFSPSCGVGGQLLSEAGAGLVQGWQTPTCDVLWVLLHGDQPSFLSLVLVLRSQHISAVAAEPLPILNCSELCLLLSLASVQVLDRAQDQITAHLCFLSGNVSLKAVHEVVPEGMNLQLDK